MLILSGASFHPTAYSLFNSYSKVMEILSGAPSSSSTYFWFNSYSKLMMKILSGASLRPQYIFLIRFSFEIDANPLWRPPPLSPLHIPDSTLLQNTLWSLPPPVLIQNWCKVLSAVAISLIYIWALILSLRGSRHSSAPVSDGSPPPSPRK